MLALDPNDALHFLYTHPPTTYRSLDGGKTRLNCNHSNVFHAGIDQAWVVVCKYSTVHSGMNRSWCRIPTATLTIDQHGTYYTAAMGGAFRSLDRGASWQAGRP